MVLRLQANVASAVLAHTIFCYKYISKGRKKYKNPANPVRNFCKQKWQPLPQWHEANYCILKSIQQILIIMSITLVDLRQSFFGV